MRLLQNFICNTPFLSRTHHTLLSYTDIVTVFYERWIKLYWVLLNALAVGSATMLGAALGLIFRRVEDTVQRCMIAFSVGVMLHSVMYGLIEPAIELSHRYRLPLLLFGMLGGFLFLSGIRLLSLRLFGLTNENHRTAALLFIFAMGVHHIPEGIAAGISFGTGDPADVITVSGGIIIQNIPEGMVLIAPLLSLGMSVLQAITVSLSIALLEALGVYFGFFAISFSSALLPFALGFAAGAMLYIMLTDMIPSSCPAEASQKPIYASFFGFSMMSILSYFL